MHHHERSRLVREHIIAIEVRKLERRRALEHEHAINLEPGDGRVRRRWADPGTGGAGHRRRGA
jgi:hypothetical protein